MPSPSTPNLVPFQLHWNPDSGEVYVDGSFIGNAPVTLNLSPGQRAIRVTLVEYKKRTRNLRSSWLGGATGDKSRKSVK